MSNTFTVNRGSDLEFAFNWPDGLGGFADLTGYTVDLMDVSLELTPYISVKFDDAATGRISCKVEWNNSFTRGRRMSFIIRIRSGTKDVTLPQMWINVV